MSGDVHVRFCEGPGVRFPRATRLVIALELEDDARRVMEVLPKRFARYGLTIHPHKTKLVDFRRPRKGHAGPESFDFLGFTHYWGTSRKGRRIVKRKTAKKRLSRSLKGINDWCRKNRHEPVSKQHQALNQKLKGHYAYFGLTGNGRSLEGYRHEVGRLWRKWLNRRSRKKAMPWPRFKRLLERWPLPPVRIVQSVYARP